VALPAPAALTAFAAPAPGEGAWVPAGRTIGGVSAVYETSLVPPGGGPAAGIAWMDTRLLAATLYSGSKSPGGGPYQFTAPVEPTEAATLVAAFNGGFLMKDAGGGYYTEGHTVVPLQSGAASLEIDADGTATVGAWGTDVTMTAQTAAVRQNLVLLVAGGQPTAEATGDWHAWGNTCGATSCSSGVPGIENQWRSGVGVTANGALVYAEGPSLAPLQLAQLLARAGAVRAMELDINPNWPVLVTYAPTLPGGLAAPANGTSLQPASVQGPATFFNPAWARDFVTMSVRPQFVSG
jgi:Phosphodiester glycosidase